MDEKELQDQLSARFKELPEKVRAAITSADVEAHLRTLSEQHKLHVDQWAILENEVMLTMLGFQKTADLAKNIAHEVGIQEDAAEALAADISKVVFEPIRAELEALAPEPEGSDTAQGAVEVRTEPTAEAVAEVPAAPTPEAVAAPLPEPVREPVPEQPIVQKAPAAPIVPATPPRTAPEKTVMRAPVSNSYAASTPSHERVAVEGDPYREQIA